MNRNAGFEKIFLKETHHAMIMPAVETKLSILFRFKLESPANSQCNVSILHPIQTHDQQQTLL